MIKSHLEGSMDFNGKHSVSLYDRSLSGRVVCKLCPRGCTLKDGQTGFCGTRQNIEGKLYTLNYGKAVRIAQEFIETEGIFHFAPNAPILSIGNMGCNLHCKFCQNWKTSQMKFIDENDFELYSPEQVVDLALKKNINILSWTYNDPAVWHEFVIDTASIARKKGLLNLYKSAFYLTLDAVKELCEVIDIFSISLKSVREDYYAKHTTAHVSPILDNIRYVYQTGIHLELSNLMVTDLNDSEEDARAVAKWHLDNTSADIPLHYVRFHPAYLYKDVPRTPVERLVRAREIALDMGVKYCYIGNVYENEGGNSFCPECHSTLIHRYDINTQVCGLTDTGKCSRCGYQTNIKIKPFQKIMKEVDTDHYKQLSKEMYSWSEEINRVHVEVENPTEAEFEIYIHRLGHENRSAQDTRKTLVSPCETYRFIISKSKNDETGIMICYPPDVKIQLYELLDRAHLPTEFKDIRQLNKKQKIFKRTFEKCLPWNHGLPKWATKKIIYPAYLHTKGLKIFDYLKNLEESQMYYLENMQQLQLSKLKALLIHCQKHVPYYQKMFKTLDFHPEDVNHIDDIKRLPILEKKDILQHHNELKTVGKKIPFYDSMTSGSTGIPLEIYTDYDSTAYNIASRIRAIRWWNLDYGMKEAYFGGSEIRKADYLLRFTDWLFRNKIVFDLKDNIMYEHYRKLLRFNPEIIYGNPSAIYIFSRFLVENKLDTTKLKIKAVISTTEVLHSYQRQFIHNVFKCPVINEYGATEAGVIAYECPHHRMHLNSDNVIVEIMNGKNDNQGNGFGELVVTNLNNYMMPIIRYKIGDMGNVLSGECTCGVKLPLLDVFIGRDCDTIVLDGKELSGAVLFGCLGKELMSFVDGGLKSFRIYQKKLDLFLFQAVMKNNGLHKLLEKRVTEAMNKYIGEKISIDFDYVDSIPRDSSGKLRYFISEVFN